jgi:hypothetical protein
LDTFLTTDLDLPLGVSEYPPLPIKPCQSNNGDPWNPPFIELLQDFNFLSDEQAGEFDLLSIQSGSKQNPVYQLKGNCSV